MKWTKENKWNKDDTVITLYFYKFGTKQLPVKDVFELVEKMGMDVETLKNQSLGIGNIINNKDVESTTKLQKIVVEEFDKMDEKELRGIVLEILDDVNRQSIISERILIHQEKSVEDKKKEDKKKLDSIFRKMGKDPSKFKSMGVRPKV